MELYLQSAEKKKKVNLRFYFHMYIIIPRATTETIMQRDRQNARMFLVLGKAQQFPTGLTLLQRM